MLHAVHHLQVASMVLNSEQVQQERQTELVCTGSLQELVYFRYLFAISRMSLAKFTFARFFFMIFAITL